MIKKNFILLIALFGLVIFSGSASAFQGKPGTNCPLVLSNYELSTDTPILPDWQPTRVRWKLLDPSGKTVSFVDDELDMVTKSGGTWTSTNWLITEHSGHMKIPAFATPGEWKVDCVLYDKQFIFTNKVSVKQYAVEVSEGDLMDNLNAPLTYQLSLPVLGDFNIAIDLIYLITVPIILIFAYLIFKTIKDPRGEIRVKNN